MQKKLILGGGAALVVIIVVLAVLFSGSEEQRPENNQDQGQENAPEQQQDEDDFYCEKDADCTPLVFECGHCADYSIAVNKKYVSKYKDLYFKKCEGKGYRTCDALPSGSSKCENNRCILIK